MKPTSYARHRFPPDVIRQAVGLCFRFTLSFRDVEDLMAARGIEVSYETIRCWVLKFGTLFAPNLRRRAKSSPTRRWHLDEVLDMLVQKRRNKAAAPKLLRKLLKNQGVHPETIVPDGLTSYGAATNELGCADGHRPGRLRENNRAECSHLAIRRRERKQQKFKSQGSARRFLATYAAVYNTFHVQRHLIHRPFLRQSRAEAGAVWAAATVAA